MRADTAVILTILPFLFLWALVKLLPPWPEKALHAVGGGGLINQHPFAEMVVKASTRSRSHYSFFRITQCRMLR